MERLSLRFEEMQPTVLGKGPRKAWHRMEEKAGHIASIIRKQKNMNTAVQIHVSFIQSLQPRGDAAQSFNLLETHRHAEVCFHGDSKSDS